LNEKLSAMPNAGQQTYRALEKRVKKDNA